MSARGQKSFGALRATNSHSALVLNETFFGPVFDRALFLARFALSRFDDFVEAQWDSVLVHFQV